MTEIDYFTGTWDRKLDFTTVFDLNRSDHPNWERINNELITVTVKVVWPENRDPQREMFLWADEHCEGYFYQHSIVTQGGTPIVHVGENVTIKFIFQKEEDAVAFKLRWDE